MPDTPITPLPDDAAEHLVAAYDEAVESRSEEKVAAAVTDPDLLAAYQRTTGAPGDPEADTLLAEIDSRGLDV